MKVKIYSSDSVLKVYELKEGELPLVPLKSCTSARIEVGDGSEAVIELRVDLGKLEVNGEAVAVTTNKEGELKQIKSIQFVDGTEDLYA